MTDDGVFNYEESEYRDIIILERHGKLTSAKKSFNQWTAQI